MPINIDVVQNQTTVEVATAGIAGSDGAPGPAGPHRSVYMDTLLPGAARAGIPQSAGSAWNPMTNGLLVCYPVFYSTADLAAVANVNGFGVHPRGVGGAGAVGRCGIWASRTVNGNLRPGTLIAQGSVDVSTAGWKQLTITNAAMPDTEGWYWHGVALQGAAGTTDMFSAGFVLSIYDGPPGATAIENVIRSDSSSFRGALAGTGFTGALADDPAVLPSNQLMVPVAVRFA